MPVDMSGMGDLLARLDRLPDAMREALKAAATREAENVLAEATPLTPKNFGTLRESQAVGVPEVSDSEVVVRFGYGGKAEKYAYYQHEGQRADGSHVVRNYTEPGTGKHYLIKAIDICRPGFEGRVAAHARNALEAMTRGTT